MTSIQIVEGDSIIEENTERQQSFATRTRKIQYAVSKRWESEQQSGQRKPQDWMSRIFCRCARQVGSMHFLCERKDGSPIVVAGPMWPFCMFVTVPIICVLGGFVLYFCMLQMKAPLPWWAAIIYAPFLVATLFSLFMVSCRDPGLIERRTAQDPSVNAFLWNEQVGSYRPPDALYCRECQVLIEDYDHLCPWTGTGIGRKNMFAFKAFVVLVNILCYGSIGITAYVLLS